jgi:hypothetical protein
LKTHVGVAVKLHAFLTSALHGSEWSATRPDCFSLGESALVTDWIRTGLVAAENKIIPCPSREWNPDPSVVRPIARNYTDWAILGRLFTFWTEGLSAEFGDIWHVCVVFLRIACPDLIKFL